MTMQPKSPHIPYQTICAIFCAIVVFSNIISAMMIKLPLLEFTIPAGLLTYPLTFLLSDLVTEMLGAHKAKQMVYTALGVSLLTCITIQGLLLLPISNPPAILALGGMRILSSLIAYLAAQIVDINLYAAIKRWTGPKHLWIRNNASTCCAQIVDTIVIDILFLWWGLAMPIADVAPIMLFSFLYKALFSLTSTPLLYLLIFLYRYRPI